MIVQRLKNLDEVPHGIADYRWTIYLGLMVPSADRIRKETSRLDMKINKFVLQLLRQVSASCRLHKIVVSDASDGLFRNHQQSVWKVYFRLRNLLQNEHRDATTECIQILPTNLEVPISDEKSELRRR